MSPEIQKWREQWWEIPSSKSLEKSAHMARKEPKKVAEAIKADPQLWVISGMWKGAKEWAVSSWDGTKAIFRGTGEFIGVWAAKLIHEWWDSFLQYTGEKTQVLRDVVHIAGEAIAVTAFEAVNGDESVIQGALEYWKGKGVEFGKLPAGKQAELLTKFSTQIAIGVIGTKGLSMVSKTTALSKTVDLAGSMNSKTGQAIGKMAEKAGSAVSMVGVEAAGLDSGAIKWRKRREKVVSESTEKTTHAEKVAKAEARSGVSHETVMKNANLSDIERLIEAEKILKEKGLLGENKSLSGIQKSEILASHNAGKGVYENTPSDLKEKIRAGKKAAEEAGRDTRDMLTKKERRLLMEHGILGSVRPEVQDIRSIVKSGDFEKQSKFLQHATPEEIGHAINHGFIDYAADDFSGDFINTLSKVVVTYEKNITNIWGIHGEFQKITKEAGKLSSEEGPMLKGIIERMLNGTGEINFKESFQSLSKSSELTSLVKTLPESVSRSEGLNTLWESIARLAISHESQKDCLIAIDAFVKKFPDSAHEWMLLAIEHIDQELWKDGMIFKNGNLKFSVHGTEFEALLQRMIQNHPEKFYQIARNGMSWSYQLQGIERAAQRIKPFNIVQFQDNFALGVPREEVWKILGKEITTVTESDLDKIMDYNRIKILLGEHLDTKFMDVKTISSRVGPENLDRFFFMSLPRLRKIAETHPDLQKQIERVLNHYGRDISGYSV